MSDEDGFFGQSVAAHYDESSADMFAPGMVGPAVEVLAELAGVDAGAFAKLKDGGVVA